MKRPDLAGLCDCHMHVFGPVDRYPGAPGRSYTPSSMGFETYRPVAVRLGIQRIVIVQPSAYGTDNRCTLDGLRTLGPAGRAVVVIDSSIDEDELGVMDRLGVRGIRLNLMTPRIDDAAAAEAALTSAADRIEALGWHVQIYADLRVVSLLATAVRRCKVPVVFDHMAGARAGMAADDPGFRILLDLLHAGDCWVKLSGADIMMGENNDFLGASACAEALIAANSENLVWGTDWPHLVHQHAGTGDAAPPAAYRPVDDNALFSFLTKCAGDEKTLRAILVDNPARLYGF